eukprot:ANDGO_06514.mRNA.1 Annexin A7
MTVTDRHPSQTTVSRAPPSPLAVSPNASSPYLPPKSPHPREAYNNNSSNNNPGTALTPRSAASATSPTNALINMIKTMRSLNPANLHALEDTLVVTKSELSEYKQISESLHKTVSSLEKALIQERRRREELEIQVSRMQAEAVARRHRLSEQQDVGIQCTGDAMDAHDGGQSVAAASKEAADGVGADIPVTEEIVYSSVNSDCDLLYEGFKSKSFAVIYKVICSRTNQQLQVLQQTYSDTYGKALHKLIEKKTSGDLKMLLSMLLYEPMALRAELLYNALHGFSLEEDAVIDIVCTANNAEIVQLRQMYSKMFSKLVDEDMQRNTAGDFRTFLTIVFLAQRANNAELNGQDLAGDAHTLFVAGEGQRFRADTQPFIQIIGTRSQAHLAALNESYCAMNRDQHDLLTAVFKVTSGALRKALVATIKHSIDANAFWAERIHFALTGFSVDESRLNRYLVLARESLPSIQQTYRERYKYDMLTEVHRRGSGSWKRAVVQLLESSPALSKAVPTA